MELSREHAIAWVEAYMRLGAAIVWTESKIGDGAKRVSSKGWNEAQPLTGEIRALAGQFAERQKTRNPAIVTANSGFVSVDCDDKVGLEHFGFLGLPKTLEVQSSSPHKRHFHFRAPPGAEFSYFEFAGGRVVAKKNQYLLVPPAIHPSGAPYLFVTNGGPLPDVALLSPDDYEKLLAAARETKEQRDPDAKIADGEGRHAAFVSKVGGWRALDMPLETALEEGRKFSAARLDPPYTEAQVREKVEDIYRRYPAGSPQLDEPIVETAPADDETPDPYVRPVWKGAPPALARCPDILAELLRDLKIRGVGGEIEISQLLYLAITSRVLPWEPTSRPVSIIVKGTSSSGKSYTATNVIPFFPFWAVIRLNSASNLYLLYDKRSLSHSFIFVPEWKTISEKEEFVSMLRVLVSEGRIEHGTVEGAGKKEARLLTKEGPTGLIMTTTAALTDPELETRCFSLRTDDTPQQTTTVFKALAKTHLEGNPDIDLDRWIELQIWIESQENRVLVPFSDELAELMPNRAVRLRRDFVTILCLIQAHAILYQAQRKRDRSGRIIATLADYEIVRDLIDVLVAEEAGGGITKAMKETRAAVEAIIEAGKEHATVAEIAERLGIGEQATRDRVSRAQVAGLLENVSEGRKKKLKTTARRPETPTFLPTMKEIKECFSRDPSRRARRSEIAPQTRMDSELLSSDAVSEADRSKNPDSYSERSSEEISELANPHESKASDVISESPTPPGGYRGDGTPQKGLKTFLDDQNDEPTEAPDLEPGWLARGLEDDKEDTE